MAPDDLYDTLGLSPDAEDIVIAAAYRALAQRYHPDKWRGDADEASRRMAAINAAYATLKDVAKRAEYDRRRSSQDQAAYGGQERGETDEAFSEALSETEDRWDIACSVYSDLRDIRSELSRVSIPLAFSFVVVMLGSKAFGERHAIGKRIERRFLERYFGTDDRIIAFARELILDGERQAARKLNRLVDVIGSSANPALLIESIEADSSLAARRGARSKERAFAEELRIMSRQVAKFGAYSDAVALAEKRGYRVEMTERGFFKASGFALYLNNVKKHEFPNLAMFCKWISSGM